MSVDRPRGAVRRVERGRLAFHATAADAAFWDQHWRRNFSTANYRGAERGGLGWFERPFLQYLPKPGRILEAGCGLGLYVVALRARGYEVEGVEWSRATVDAVLSVNADYPIRHGDVTRLDVPDGHYAGYISLGVMEHRHEGPEPFLREAHRILTAGGVALISVPHFHVLRRWKARFGAYRGRVEGMDFYQYAFTRSDFGSILEAHGFRIVEVMAYDAFKGIKDEVALVRRMLSWPRAGPRLTRALKRWAWGDRHFGHMMLFVCRRTAPIRRLATK